MTSSQKASQPVKPLWVRIVRILAISYLLYLLLLKAMERQFIFIPSPANEQSYAAARSLPGPGKAGQLIEDYFVDTEDGERLHGWRATPILNDSGEMRPQGKRRALIWAHGNAGNISNRLDMLMDFVDLQTTVYLYDYRGYGKSTGKPTEAGLYRDIRAVWKHVTASEGYAPGEVIIFGKSLGGGSAVQLATEVDAAGLIVQSSFTSIPEMAGLSFPLVPRFIVGTKFDSLSKITQVRCPVLIVHSPADEIVPYRMGEQLFAAAQEPKRWYSVPGAGHNVTYMVGGKPYRAALKAFIDEVAMSPAVAHPETETLTHKKSQ